MLKTLAVGIIVTLSTACAAHAGEPPRIGAAAPDFNLPAASDGKSVALKELLGKHKAVVVMFIATRCPFSNGYNARMAQLQKDYNARGIAFVGINSNKTEPVPEIVEHARKHGFEFPVLRDEGNKIADLYAAKKTPEIYVLDPKGMLLYHGRIDETHDDPAAVKFPNLRNALDAILAGKAVPIAETKAFGCSIKRL